MVEVAVRLLNHRQFGRGAFMRVVAFAIFFSVVALSGATVAYAQGVGVGGGGTTGGGLRSELLLSLDDKAVENFAISQRIIQIIQLSGKSVTKERFVEVLDKLAPSEEQRAGAREMFEAMYEASQAVK
jgi:hypothetical protein